MDADIEEATLRLCRLDGVSGSRLRAVSARIEDCFATGADLCKADFDGASLTESTFARANLRECSLDRVEGAGVVLRGADLVGATLVQAHLDDADLRGADLTGADLRELRAHGADFRGAILEGCHWEGADVEGALFDADIGQLAPDQGPDFARRAGGPGVPKVDLPSAASLRSAFSDPGTPAELRDLSEALERAIADRRLDADDLFASLEPLLRLLDEMPDDEPPEAWKDWLARLARYSDS